MHGWLANFDIERYSTKCDMKDTLKRYQDWFEYSIYLGI
jgi:hypothetical protein